MQRRCTAGMRVQSDVMGAGKKQRAAATDAGQSRGRSPSRTVRPECSLSGLHSWAAAAKPGTAQREWRQSKQVPHRASKAVKAHGRGCLRQMQDSDTAERRLARCAAPIRGGQDSRRWRNQAGKRCGAVGHEDTAWHGGPWRHARQDAVQARAMRSCRGPG
jgi:hypothetical protein